MVRYFKWVQTYYYVETFPIWLSNSDDLDEMMQNIAFQLGLPCKFMDINKLSFGNCNLWPSKFYQTEQDGSTVAQWLSAWLETEGLWVWASPASLRCGPWARHIYPSLVLVQPRKTCSCLTERLLMDVKNKIKQSNWTGDSFHWEMITRLVWQEAIKMRM